MTVQEFNSLVEHQSGVLTLRYKLLSRTLNNFIMERGEALQKLDSVKEEIKVIEDKYPLLVLSAKQQGKPAYTHFKNVDDRLRYRQLENDVLMLQRALKMVYQTTPIVFAKEGNGYKELTKIKEQVQATSETSICLDDYETFIEYLSKLINENNTLINKLNTDPKSVIKVSIDEEPAEEPIVVTTTKATKKEEPDVPKTLLTKEQLEQVVNYLVDVRTQHKAFSASRKSGERWLLIKDWKPRMIRVYMNSIEFNTEPYIKEQLSTIENKVSAILRSTYINNSNNIKI